MQLNERLYTVSRDVDTIYKLGKFESFIKSLYDRDKQRHEKLKSSNPNERIPKYYLPEYPYQDTLGGTTFKYFSSEELKSKDCIMAHNLNPINIRCGIYRDGSYYDAVNKIIQISINYSALRHLYSSETIEDAISRLPLQRQKKVFPKEFTPERIKATISHELSHWIDDSIHNNFINNLLINKQKFGYDWMQMLGVKNVNMTYFEIQGQIHGIKEARRKHLKKWDTMTLADLFNIYPSLDNIHEKLSDMHGYEISKLWQTNLVRRMAREGLLGKNMRNFVK
ncbi:hypothetical protein [Microcystis phage Mel-JY01]